MSSVPIASIPIAIAHQNRNLNLNATLRALCREGRLKEAIHILLTTTTNNPPPLVDRSTCLQLLETCIANKFLAEGKFIHSHINDKRDSLSPSTLVFLQNKLIHMYVSCGSLADARKVFDCMTERDDFSWNMIISAYQRHGLPWHSMTLFHHMQQTEAAVQPNQFTFSSILQACAKLRDLKQGLYIHQRLFKSGFWSNVVVANALIDMYAKCGRVQEARELFDKMPQQNVVSWNTMIAGYVRNGFVEKARELFDKLSHRDAISWTVLIVGYAQNGIIEKARELFDKLSHPDAVSWTAMIAGYAQNGLVEKGRELFDKMPCRDQVSWTAMIAGYTQNGHGKKALEIFRQMQLEDVKPNPATFVSILPACAKMGALQQGMDIHERIVKTGFLSDVLVMNALIDMYAKCGSIHKARALFDKMPQLDTVSWNAMIAGYAMHSYSKDALKLFEHMKYLGTNPNHVSYICVLYACSHAGLVDEGCKYFNNMSEIYSIMPTMDHYVCMADLLSRGGYLEEAINFIIKMPIKHEVVVWKSLLGACRSHKNISIGEFVATLVFALDPKNAASYVLLSNIYAEVGRWVDVENVRKLMKERGIKKTPGCSWIEVHKTVHIFFVGDRSHPQTQEIYAKLEELSREIQAAGYIPDTIHALRDVEDEDKGLLLYHHSEKLAIAFGLLNTPPETTITVVKNLRVCADCHTATKFISKIVAREIVVRDANRFHHFKHGECSCGDYW